MNPHPQSIYEFGPYQLNTSKRLLSRDGANVSLTPKCFDILLTLIESCGVVVTKDDLIKRVWPDTYVEEGNLTYNISILRKVLGERAGEHQHIVTVPGRGYQFVGTVRELNTERSDNGVTALPQADRVGLTLPRSRRVAVLVGPDLRRSPESFFRKVTQNKRAALIAAALLVIAGAAISVGLYKLIARNQPGSNLAEPFQKMRVTRLTRAGKASVAASSPDGKYVVHAIGSRSNQSLWLRHIATGSDTELIPTAAVDYTALTFSPDGNYIYFVRSESVGGSLYRVPVLGDAIQKLVIDVDSGIAFSFDGREIAYIRGYPERDEARIITANADGTGEQTLVSKRMSDVFASASSRAWGPAWSPDGERIAFALKKDEPDGRWVNVMTVGVKDKTVQQITFQQWVGLGQLAWLSDGSGLIAAAGEEESNLAQLWHVSYPTGEVRRITNDANDYSGVSLTADSATLVTVQSEQSSNIWVAPGGDASRAAQITFSNLDGVDGISWAPDGRILYTTRARGSSDIWIMNGDGTDQTPLTVDARDNLRPSVSYDGRYVVFASNRTGNRCVWRVDIDGSNAKQLSSGMDARDPEITPDGQWVVYLDAASGRLTLWKVSIEGNNQVQLTDHYSGTPAVSPDGKQIAFSFVDEQATAKRVRIAIMPLSGGPPIKVLDQPVGRRLVWALDGRALLYADTRNGVSNIWGHPIDDGPAKQLTNFTSDLIFAFAWSKDGKQLACARGNRNSDVVMISGIR